MSQQPDSLYPFVADLRSRLADRLDAVLVHTTGGTGGTGARAAEPVVIVDQVDGPLLRSIRDQLPHWRRKGIATPLLLDRAHLSEARDVFPLEMLELHDCHVAIYGAIDPFENLDINLEHLRLEIEEQLKGKVIHLRAAYLESRPRTRDLSMLLMETPEGFVVSLRGLLYLRNKPRPDTAHGVVVAVENEFGEQLPTTKALLEFAASGKPPNKKELETLFDRYLEEMTRVSRLLDTLSEA
ncbi:MAG: hypothetical protein ACI8TX_002142 [Hyphomicrobiaceae bacterium]|jgi:hypothetical protein